MSRSPLLQQVDSLPELIRSLSEQLIPIIADALPPALAHATQHVFLTGCGDSHHAAVGAELAFQQLAGLPCRAATAMQFGRYTAPYLPGKPTSNLLLAISVSGRVSRTVEALKLARRAGATTVALTGNPKSPLAQAAAHLLATAVPALHGQPGGAIVPGVRSYTASQLALYLCAIQLGATRRHLTTTEANNLRQTLRQTAERMAESMGAVEPVMRELAANWSDAQEFVYCGAGPSLGAALFSAAKLLEASGDTAVAQDTEEWAHLQYFGRHVATPTFLISGGRRDERRVQEVATAATAIGRRVAIIAQGDSALAQMAGEARLLPLAGPIRDCFSPLLTSLPGLLFAAYRAELLGERYFRAFSGGRSAQDGGGISRIRTSEQMTYLPEELSLVDSE
jgi:glutamine---fructose-6-phosphate transaminase (isomerizing)